MEGDSVILRNHFLGVEYRPWESLWPGSPSQNSFFSSCFCHTWDRLGPGLRSHEASKCKDTIKGGKVLHVCTVGTDYEQQDTKRSNPNSHYWGVGSKSKVVSISQHTAPATGWADHLSHPSCLTNRSAPTLSPHKGPARPPWDRARELVSLPSNCSKNSDETERDPIVLAPPCTQPAFCPWERFSHTLSLIREVRKWRN